MQATGWPVVNVVSVGIGIGTTPMRRVVFIGNCQVQSLSQLYQRFFDGDREEEVSYLPSYEDLTDDRIAAIAEADVIVEQRMDVAPRAEIGGIASNAERHFVPLLAGGFLWPHAGQEHPRNESLWFMPSGPYGGEMADSYLNRLIDAGMPPAEAVDQYLALDVARVRHLDRFFELVIDRQRSRDTACGYQIADLIEERFREEPMFRTPHHPNLRLALAFIAPAGSGVRRPNQICWPRTGGGPAGPTEQRQTVACAQPRRAQWRRTSGAEATRRFRWHHPLRGQASGRQVPKGDCHRQNAGLC